MKNALEEGATCPTGCGGTLHLPPVEGCSCHIAPPCGACTDQRLTCDACGWELPEAKEECWPDTTTPKSEPNPWLVQHQEAKRRGHTFAHGGRVFDVSHNGRSGSTQVIEGRYEGPVTAADIIGYFGEGTFGHRGPTLRSDRQHLTGPALNTGTFTYTKITD